jgi:hypothetical protein
MRIDSKSAIGGYPALKVRELLRTVNNLLYWDIPTVQGILRSDSEDAGGVIRASVAAGLAKSVRSRVEEGWTTTQLGQSFASATAAQAITRATAERTSSALLARLEQVTGVTSSWAEWSFSEPSREYVPAE